MRSEIKLPLKVVPALEPDYYKPDVGGGDPKVFDDVTAGRRQELASSVIDVRDTFRNSFRQFPRVPAVATLRVKADAVAKSHRPTRVFSTRTCPIIGSQGLGELLLSVTPTGLEALARAIETDDSVYGTANISTVDSIKAYTPQVDLPLDLSRPLKVKLFIHHRPIDDDALVSAFVGMLRRNSVGDATEIRYGRGLRVYRVDTRETEAANAVSMFVGTQSVGPFPIYYPLRASTITRRKTEAGDFPPPDPNEDYPVVGVIDSGVPEDDEFLKPWVVDHETDVPPEYQDNTHGSFVSGLIVHPRLLNGDERFPSCSSRVLDVVAVPAAGISEDRLLPSIEGALERYRSVKVWNLSLARDRGPRVDDRMFSDFAVAFDRLQYEYGVTFVLAAGNYTNQPLRGWPPDVDDESDRICPPADSVRALVVGSVAHLAKPSSRVRADSPSPFSRRGPGPLYLPKPEVAHIGGNCDEKGMFEQVGVLSVDGKGHIAENIGTSFATPLVSTVFANVGNRIVGGASRLLTRALLVHSAAMRGGRVDEQLLRYRGFGVPDDVEGMLGCEASECTLLFELSIPPTLSFEKGVFPMPPCLYANPDTLRANILMTLVYEPELDASFGSEYCRTNIEVSLGTYDVGTDGKRHQKKQVPEDPCLKGSSYERDLVQHGFKWSPVKVYRREMVRGVKGQLWRLDLSVHHRSGHTPTRAQDAALVITVADPDRIAPVYNQMVQQMNLIGWAATDLQLRPRIRA